MGQLAGAIEGYQDPVEYRTNWSVVVFLNLLLFWGGLVVLFPNLIIDVLRGVPYRFGTIQQFLITNVGDVLGFVGFVLLFVLVHESIHTAVHRTNGFELAVGIKWVWTWNLPNPAPYVVVLDSLIPRNKNIAGLTAPLLVLNGLALVGMLPIFPPLVVTYSKVVLLLNTAGSCSDIYHTVRVFRKPAGTMFINLESGTGIDTYYYVPSA